MISGRRVLLALTGASLAAAGPAGADGVWLDLGANQETYVHETGGPSWERFPAFAFGTGWPAGTLAYVSLEPVTCAQLPAGCDATNVVAAWIATFDGTLCGCGGQLLGACSLRLYYDPLVVAALGGDASQLVLAHLTGSYFSPRWAVLSDGVIQTAEHFVEAGVLDAIGGTRYYALFRTLPTPPTGQPTTWGRIKQLWR